MNVARNSIRFTPTLIRCARISSGQMGDLGSGAGRGGGGGGSIRAAGGAFGKLEAAREEEYFYNKQREQLERLKNDQIHQAEFHHQQIKEHEDAIRRHKKFLNGLANPSMPKHLLIQRAISIEEKGKSDEARYYRTLDQIQMVRLRLKIAKQLGDESEKTEKLKKKLEEMEKYIANYTPKS